jgi:hypothetical protein
MTECSHPQDSNSSEQVHIENEWYDGPRAGIADIQGTPYRFKSRFDEKADEYLGTYLVWPANTEELALEQEQWAIFVRWNDDYERGIADVETHPGNAGVNKRWAELDALLKDRREIVPGDARRAKADLVRIEREARYTLSGPDYRLRWNFL